MSKREGFRIVMLMTLVLVLGSCSEPGAAENNADGEKKAGKIPISLLWPDGAPGAKGDEPFDKPLVHIFLPPKDERNGSAVVVCPGGGYGHLAMGHEGRDIAEWLNSNGVCAFVLQYRHAARYHHPSPLLDVQRAIRMVRHRSDQVGVDPARIGVMGFSAGGHLASTAGTHFDKGDPDADDPIDRASCRPDFMILAYPVISFTTEYTHRGSRTNLLGRDADKSLWEKFSNEKQVTPETPPAFLVHTDEDPAVPAENSVLFYLALRKAGVPAELHIYEKGRHGLGLAPDKPAFSNWPAQCINWMRGRGLFGKQKN